ncbi:MAG: hypothetical protein FJ095_05105 [Deltaproteobacteria bacterium]|nr:hypothetical protein [Deltaproteobacteria bacterium]
MDESAGNAAEPALDAAVTGAAAHAEENAPEVTGSKLILVNPRSRARLRAALAFGVGLAAGLFGGRATVRDGDTTDGIALALGAAVDGTVDREAFVWEASQGFLHDAVRGRGVTFRAELTTGEAKQHDVFHARVRLGREGRALSVVEVRNLTETPDADEGELVGHAGVVGFLSWHEGRVTGLTAIALARWCDGASALDRILAATAERLSTHNGSPWPTWRVTLPALASEAELQGFDGALEARTDAGTLRLELETGALAMSPTLVGRAEAGPIPVVVPSLGGALASVGAAAWRRLGMSKEHPSTHAPEAAAAREPPSSSAAPGEAARVWPPALEGVGDWRAVVDGASDGAPAALLTAALQFANGTSVELAAIDTRALVVEPHAGWNSPRATTGPGGLGQVRSRSGGEVVARLEARPFGSGGFVEDGRTLIPPIAAPALVVDREGMLGLGPWSSRAPTTPFSLVQGALPPEERGRLGLLCRTASRHLVFAHGARLLPSELDALGRRAGCNEALFLAPSREPLLTGERATKTSGPLADEFFVLARRLDAATSLGVDEPVEVRGIDRSSPAVHRQRIERRDGVVELSAIDTTRFTWRLLPGADGQRHTCERALDEGGDATVALRLGLGASEVSRPRGLALDGTVVTPFTADRAVLEVRRDDTPKLGAQPLGLALTVDGMTTDGDAGELVLLAEAGVVRREARELGANRRRAVVCMRGRGLLLHAAGVFDNSAPLVEEVLSRGCRRVASADRGRLASGALERSGVEESPRVRDSEAVLVGVPAPPRGLALTLSR